MNLVFIGVWTLQFATAILASLLVLIGVLILLSLAARSGASKLTTIELEPATLPIPRPLDLAGALCGISAHMPSRAPPDLHSPPPDLVSYFRVHPPR